MEARPKNQHLSEPPCGPLHHSAESEAASSRAKNSDGNELERLAELESIYATAPVGLCVIDRDMRFVRINERMAEINGVPAHQHIGRHIRDVVPGLIEPAERLMRQVVETEEAVLDQEVRGVTPAQPDVERIWMESWHPLRNSNGEICAVNVVAEEVTEQRRAETERARLLEELKVERSRLRQAKEEAEDANQAKTQFLTAMSHDLRTPLNAIGGYVDLLELGVYGDLADEQRLAIERIRINHKVLLTLINDVLHFAKLDVGELAFTLTPVPLQPILRETEAFVAPQVSEKGIRYTWEDCDVGLHVRADHERVRQIVLNLMTNAIKYTPEGGRITLAASEAAGWGEIRVSDSGPGIAPEMQEKIFDPFVQIVRRIDHPSEGVGLGLAISRNLANRMGGNLTVESREGEGSTFCLRLPTAGTQVPDGARTPPIT